MSAYKKVGRYSIVKKLGEGVYGKVYLARETNESPLVALKWTLKDDSPTRAELKVMNNIEPHPNVVRLHEHFTAPQAACLAYEYCEGGDLNGWLQRQGCVPARLACSWALDMASGVQAVHRAGFLHCDLKSDNVLLKFNSELERYQLKLIDFGLARQLKANGKGSKLLVPEVETGPYYSSAPEVFDGSAVGEKADVFALGLMFLSMFHPIVVDDGTFRLAAPYVTDERYWGKALREVPQSVIRKIVAEHVPESFLALVNNMLQLDVTQRPALTEVLEQLRRIQKQLKGRSAGRAHQESTPLPCALQQISERHATSATSLLGALVRDSPVLAAVGVA